MKQGEDREMNKRSVGAQYEKIAAEHLETLGLRVLTQNFRCRYGEVDLIAKDGQTLVFAEVKYRKNQKNGFPEEAVSRSKMQTISRVADYYRLRRQVPEETPVRFDVIAIEGSTIRYHKNAFPYSCR
jgi:putative endonuclease